MDYATEDLRALLEKTAKHLACRDLDLIWEVHDKFGKCSRRADNRRIVIRLNPTKEFIHLYSIFLHETAHALYFDLKFKDREAIELAADEQFVIWGISVGALLPTGMDWRCAQDPQDLIERLKILRRFGRERHGYQDFLGAAVKNNVLNGLQQIIPHLRQGFERRAQALEKGDFE